jgi:hypothetical protein
MSGFDFREFLQAASAAAVDGRPSRPVPARPARVPTAEGVADVLMGPSYSPVVLAGAIRLIEFLIVAGTGILVHQIYLADDVAFNVYYGLVVAGAAALTVILLQAAGAYSIGAFRAFFLFGLRILAAWSLVVLIALTVVFFAKTGENVSRVWLASLYLVGGGALLAERLILSVVVSSLTRAGRFDRRTAIVGGAEAAEKMIRSLDAQVHSGIRIVGVFDDRAEDRSPDIVAGYPKLGTVDDLVAYARRTKIDLVIFTMPISAENRILQMLSKLWVLPIDIRLSAHSSKLRLRPRSYSYIGSVPVLDVFDKPIADWDLVLKWLFDKFVGTAILIAASPVLLAAAIAVKLDSRGPVFFRQKRYGFNNELIEVFKFRSMYVDQCDTTAAKLVTKGDPPGHQGRPLYPQDLDRRTASALQRRVQGRPLAGRPASSRPPRQGREPALRPGRRRLFRPPQGEARHHRLGAGERLARRNGYERKDPASGRVRSLLHRELVRVLRLLHRRDHALRSPEIRKRVLSLGHDARCRCFGQFAWCAGCRRLGRVRRTPGASGARKTRARAVCALHLLHLLHLRHPLAL